MESGFAKYTLGNCVDTETTARIHGGTKCRGVDVCIPIRRGRDSWRVSKWQVIRCVKIRRKCGGFALMKLISCDTRDLSNVSDYCAVFLLEE